MWGEGPACSKKAGRAQADPRKESGVKKKQAGAPCVSPRDQGLSCCKVEAVVTVDERGQMVLPKEVRDKVGLCPGDKLAVISWEKEGQTCCLSLIKTEELTGLVRAFLGPMMEDLAQG